MNTSEIIDLLKKAINSDELADIEVKECQRYVDDIEIVVNDFIEDGSTSEDDIIEKCTHASEYLRLLNVIDNVQLEKLLELPLVLTSSEEVGEDETVDLDSDDEDTDEESEDSDDEGDDDDAFDKSSLDY